MCHGYKFASLSCCCQLLPCSDGEKAGFLVTILEVLQLQPQKNTQSNHIYVSVGIVRLSHVRTRQCTSTPSLQKGCVFESQDAWFHDPMLLSADTMNILHQRTRLSSPSKQVSNWQHQLRLASLYLWHITMSLLCHNSSSSSSTTVGSIPVGVWRHCYYRCPPLPI